MSEKIADELLKLGFVVDSVEASYLQTLPAIELFKAEPNIAVLKFENYSFIIVFTGKELMKNLSGYCEELLPKIEQFILDDRKTLETWGRDLRNSCKIIPRQYEGGRWRRLLVYLKSTCPLNVNQSHEILTYFSKHSAQFMVDFTRPARPIIVGKARDPNHALISPLIIIGNNFSDLANIFEKYYHPNENPFRLKSEPVSTNPTEDNLQIESKLDQRKSLPSLLQRIKAAFLH